MPAYKSKTMLAVDALRERIVAGEISPGERFDVRRIAAEMEMSITPIREALRILQADGLVAYDEHRSISAMTLQSVDAEELYQLRCVVEELATELAARHLDDGGREAILAAHADMLAAVAATDMERATQANRRWHFAVYGAGHTKFVEPVIERLWARYAWSTIYSIPGRVANSVTEHQAITDAVLAGDAKRAGKLMRSHILAGRRSLDGHRRATEQSATARRRTGRRSATTD
jgi:DNA-binding GntR family transcriptional regulator